MNIPSNYTSEEILNELLNKNIISLDIYNRLTKQSEIEVIKAELEDLKRTLERESEQNYFFQNAATAIKTIIDNPAAPKDKVKKISAALNNSNFEF